ncbi:MAG: hypothetical protein V3T72_18270 [Thermoanaerobaculia bacterium]
MPRLTKRGWIYGLVALFLLTTVPVAADHSGSHLTLCNAADTAGGGALGVSPGPVGPPNSLGWDVGSGQCNGSFTLATDLAFPGSGIELGLRAEERRIGQVARLAGDNYEVQTGNDTTAPPATNRAWWNFHLSIASGGLISDLDALTLQIRTDASTNLPVAPSFDLLALRVAIDARNNQPNATSTWSDLYQVSQNPEFGWFATASDTDANPTGAFNYDEEGAWRFRITATEGVEEEAVDICIHTPNAACLYPVAGIAKQMTPVDATLPATIQIDYSLENFGGDTLLALSIVDDLAAVFGVHGADWTFTSISSMPPALADMTFDGNGNNQLVAAAQSLAGGATASITVLIELLTVANADMSGDFCNQVTLQGEDSLGASYSDLSVSGSDPDSNGDDDPAEQSSDCFNQSSVPVTLQGFSIE